MSSPVTVLVASRNRPLYLWACLDSLFRGTRHPHRFVFLDMASDDPLVPEVVEGFQRRRMFAEVEFASSRHSSTLVDFTMSKLPSWGEFFAYVETDVIVPDLQPCWLEQMSTLMVENPKLAMLGSAIDKRDFIDLDFAESLQDDFPDKRLKAIIKATSSERRQDISQAQGEALFRPHNPAGRLMMIRSKALEQVRPGTDTEMDRKFTEAGFETSISTKVVHRHLSLLNLFDYKNYDIEQRDLYMKSLND